MKKTFCSLVILTLTLVSASSAKAQDTVLKGRVESNRIDRYKAPSLVPVLSTELISSANGSENEILRAFMLEKPDAKQFSGHRIAILATDGVEELELTIPYKYFKERGAYIDLVAPKRPNFPDKFGITYPDVRQTHILTVHFMENSGWVRIDKFVDESNSTDYDAFIIPGGSWSPDAMRINADAIKLIREANLQNKPLLSLCHGILLFVNAEIVKGRRMSSFWNIRKDIENAGASWFDEPCVVDGNMITGRYPFDLPELITAFSKQLNRK